MISIENEDWELIPIKIRATSSVKVKGDIQLEFIYENEALNRNNEPTQIIYFDNIHSNEIKKIIPLDLANKLSFSIQINLKLNTAKKHDALITFTTKDLVYPYEERITSLFFENILLQQTQKVVLFVTFEQEP